MKSPVDTKTGMIISVGIEGHSLKGMSLQRNLCNHCARVSVCSERKRMNKAEDSAWKIQAPVARCDAYVAPIVFRDERGWVVGQVANTMRLGPAWANRLGVHVGTKVALLNKENKIFAVARLRRAVANSREIALRFHSWHNHMFLDIKNELSREEAEARMRKILIANYGANRLEETSHISVIDLEPIAIGKDIRNVLSRR